MADEKLLLTKEDIIGIFDEKRHFKNGVFNFVEFGLDVVAKAKPIIEKPLRQKIAKLQKKLVTTNVYYLREIQEAKEHEKDRIMALLEKEYPPITTWPCWAALKGGKRCAQ